MSADVWCVYHMCSEEVIGEPYRICGECSHVFASEEVLLQAAIEMWAQRFEFGDDIHSCPYCIHDW